MFFRVLTLFPEVITGPLGVGLLGRAFQNGLARLEVHNIRDFALDKHRVVDDVPYGGGSGMVLKPEPMVAAIEHAREQALENGEAPHRVILMNPQGRQFTQKVARNLAETTGAITLVCGKYEGYDERILSFVDDEISIGDFVLSGGEFAALAVIDAVTRLLPGVLGNQESPVEESFSEGVLEYPQYTRPRSYRGMEVPEILLSGDHGRIRQWRRLQSLIRTKERRPDLLENLELTPEDLVLLNGDTNGESG